MNNFEIPRYYQNDAQLSSTYNPAAKQAQRGFNGVYQEINY